MRRTQQNLLTRKPPKALFGMLLLLSASVVRACDPGFYDTGSCVICPAGSSCDGTSQTACTAGTYAVGGAESCENCPEGYGCASTSATPVACDEGEYSDEGTTTCTACGAGTFCNDQGASSDTACSTGYYASGTENAICLPCPAGSECALNSITACTAGEYTDGQDTNCQACPAGSYCPSTDQAPIACPTGTYQDGTGQTSCLACPAGSECTSTSASPTGCSAGEFSLEGENTCTQCPAGYSCASTTALPVECDPGQYSAAGASTCTDCSDGSKCETINGSETACTGTNYQDGTNPYMCAACPLGFECTTSAASACASTEYRDDGVTVCTARGSTYEYIASQEHEPVICPSGTYTTNNPGDGDCDDCTEDYYCPGDGQRYSCTAGNYCPVGSEAEIPLPDYYEGGGTDLAGLCDLGDFSETTGEACEACPAGFSCDRSDGSTTACTQGWYSDDGDWECLQCPAGSDCWDGSASTLPVDCAAGTYSEIADGDCTTCASPYACPATDSSVRQNCQTTRGVYYDNSDTDYCAICPAGSYCPDTSDSPITCNDGEYSLPGAHQCTECPIGHYCPDKTLPERIMCQLGTYAPDIGHVACVDCPENFQCNHAVATACPTNMYSELGDGYCKYFDANMYDDDRNTCANGQYKARGQDTCTDCPIGHYCAGNDQLLPAKCLPGTAQGSTGQTSCNACSSGEYSRFGEKECHTCPKGHKCPSTSTLPQICPRGTYATSGQTSCTACNDGYICNPGSSTATPAESPCPAGFYCTHSGTTLTVSPCTGGTFSAATGQTSDTCSACNAGYFCPAGATQEEPCPPGAYCAGGDSFNFQTCGDGKYQPDFLQTSNAACEDCPAFFMCPAGAKMPLNCPSGGYCAATVATKTTCGAGFYTAEDSIDDSGDCITCPKGHYCPDGSSFPIACPMGTYNDQTGQSVDTACTNCPDSKPCPYTGLETFEVGLYCLPGHYCPEGTKYPGENACEAGTFSNDITILAQGDCETCPEKYACYEGTNAITMPMVRCSPGHYCPAGTTDPSEFKCPAGTFSDSVTLKESAECLPCTAGKYCEEASTEPTGDCEQGYYCPEGSTTAQENACPSGTYSDQAGNKALSECMPCEPGYYCDGTALTAMTACDLGLYTDNTGSDSVADCVDCPAGYKCDNTGTGIPTICGEGTFSEAGSQTCTDCEEGHYCESEGTSRTEMEATSCPDGFECTIEGMVYPVHPTHSCPAGSYCVGGVTTGCPAGTYNPTTGADSVDWCIDVPAGFYTDTVGSSAYTECPSGYLCPEGSSSGTANKCDGGFYKLTTAGGNVECGSCPSGYYCPPLVTSPVICPAGFYCNEEVEYPTACPRGQFNPNEGMREESDCEDCFGGRYCSQPGLAGPEDPCDEGYFCQDAAASSAPLDDTEGNICPAGGYCVQGSSKARNCLPGTYNPNVGAYDAADCIDCDAGSYCAGSASATVTGDCEAGYYCTGGSSHQFQFVVTPGHYSDAGATGEETCDPGTYQPEFAQDSCLDCEAGFLCPNTAMDVMDDCPIGEYCIAAQQTGTECPAGTYNPITNLRAEDECFEIPEGYWSDDTGVTTIDDLDDCGAGIFCPGGVTDDTDAQYVCPAGHYCDGWTPIPCPAGTYNPNTGSDAIGDCEPCDAGKYCSKIALEAVEGDCEEGFYCPGSDTSARPTTFCDVGEYCPEGVDAPTDCAGGTYQDETHSAECKECPAGYFCEEGAETYTICPSGHFCEAGSEEAEECPIGTYNSLTARTAEIDCIPCTSTDAGEATATCSVAAMTAEDAASTCAAGDFCPIGDVQTACPAAHYCKDGENTVPKICPEGYTCADQTADPVICAAGNYCTGGVSTPCPADFYCPEGVSRYLPCPPGTYNAVGAGQSTCSPCPAGQYCYSTNSAMTVADCDAGYACSGSATNPTPFADICPVGHFCTSGTTAPEDCDPGDYQDETGQDSCKECPAGYYCPDQTEAIKCEPNNSGANFYCPAGSDAITDCPDGTFNMQIKSDTEDDCIDCPPGYFCPNVANEEKIQSCPEGNFCAGENHSGNLEDCPIGFYCPEGTQTPIPCDPGYQCLTTNLAEPADLCPAEYYCEHETDAGTAHPMNDGADELVIADEIICPAGYYCPQGSAVPTPCPVGTYKSAQGGDDEATDCIVCDAGKACTELAKVDQNDECAAGYFCEAGSETDEPTSNPCPAGYYCPAGTSTAQICQGGTYQPNILQTSCLPCPEMYYCPDTGMTEPTICPTGQYCPGGATNPTNCPEGFYNDLQGKKEEDECAICPPGRYCDTAALDYSGDNCDGGYGCFSDDRNDPITANTEAAYICADGYWSSEGSSSCSPCSPGTYGSGAGNSDSDCSQCDSGKVCPEFGMTSADQEDCPEGYYCPNTGAISEGNLDGSTIIICSKGSYCEGGNEQPEDCAAGTYNDDLGAVECKACPKGRYCPSTGYGSQNNDPPECPAGKYCPEGSVDPLDCPAGSYSGDTGLYDAGQCKLCDKGYYCEGGEDSTSGKCDSGYLCPYGSSTGTPANYHCPGGHYCTSGASSPSQCPRGTYYPDSDSDIEGAKSLNDCLECPEGKYCERRGDARETNELPDCSDGYYCAGSAYHYTPIDGTTGDVCPKGYYCEAGILEICAAGSYQNRIGTTECETCPMGYYCPSEGLTEPTICDQYSYCNAGVSEPTTCPDGTYQSTGVTGLERSSQCKPCETGLYCVDGKKDTANICQEGYFCLSGATASDDEDFLCPTGFYCQYQTTIPIQCPESTYTLEFYFDDPTETYVDYDEMTQYNFDELNNDNNDDEDDNVEDDDIVNKRGAATESDCIDCPAGYYCLEDGTLVDCPTGHYCPEGETEPIECDEGKWQPLLNRFEEKQCKDCSAGSLCNDTGIPEQNDFLCPPGHYCERGAEFPEKCPEGTYRSMNGGRNLRSCSKCPGGYICPDRGSVTPTVCKPGYECPPGSIEQTNCPSGNYCPEATAYAIPCPGGFFCPGRSETYIKCFNGTYCPEGSSYMTPCPAGSFGIANPHNTKFENSCAYCGRGMYSTQEQPANERECKDCEIGSVCLKGCSSAQPLSIEEDSGYQCPPGHYCPKGSYEEKQCPPGTYSKWEGRGRLDDCKKCKVGYYSEKPGSEGCNKCGPSATSIRGATQCSCIGENRKYQKHTGNCLCRKGYKPKNDKKDRDSDEDCEAIVQAICTEDEFLDKFGKCLNLEEEKEKCQSTCGEDGGRFIKRTGICKCNKIVDEEQVCNRKCQKERNQISTTNDGKIKRTKPDGTEEIVEPDDDSGMKGQFTCEDNTAPCQIRTIGKNENGDFTFDYSDGASIDSTFENSEDEDDDRRRRRLFENKRARRNLQEQTAITNPVMCIKQFDSVLFEIEDGRYPVYLKDSILNSNEDFDYGPFLQLARMVEQDPSQVSSYSYSFLEKGIYVFGDSQDEDKVTIIGVVLKDQECSNADLEVKPATAQSLAEIGVETDLVTVDPNWSFIGGTFVMMILMAYGIVGLIIYLHNRNFKLRKGAATSDLKANIYFDEQYLREQEERRLFWLRLFPCCGKKELNRILEEREKRLKEQKKAEDDITYQDLQNLLDDFNFHMSLMKAKFEEGQKNKLDKDPEDEEDELLRELMALKNFVGQNKEVIQDYFGIKDNSKKRDNRIEDYLNVNPDDYEMNENDIDMMNLLRKQAQREAELAAKMRDETQKDLMKSEDQNVNANDKLREVMRAKLAAQGLNEQEQNALLDEMGAKVGFLGAELSKEQQSQNERLNSALERRRKKKQAMQGAVQKLHQKQGNEKAKYENELRDMANMEEIEKMRINEDMLREKEEGLKEIEDELAMKKKQKLSGMEKRLDKAKKDGNVDFADLLNEYGNMVKGIDADQSDERKDMRKLLEEKLAKRKADRLKALQKKKEEIEQGVDDQLDEKNKKTQADLDQMKGLLMPVTDEEKRIAHLIQTGKLKDPLDVGLKQVNMRPQTASQRAVKLENQMFKEQDEEDRKIEELKAQLERERLLKLAERELEKKAILKKIDDATDPDEKKEYIEEFERLKKAQDESLTRETQLQHGRLKEALAQRRIKKQAMASKVQQLKEEDIMNKLKQIGEELIRRQKNATTDEVEEMAAAVQQAFTKEEAIQVCENLLDQRHNKDLQRVMDQLFSERTDMLRDYMNCVMENKKNCLEKLAQEFTPQYEWLKKQRSTKSISEDAYRKAVEALAEEESDRRTDLELALSDREVHVSDMIKEGKVDCRADLESAARDKHARERVAVLEKLQEGCTDPKEAVSQYLKSEKRYALKDLDKIKANLEREKLEKLDEIKGAKEKRERELVEKEEHMLNWEDRVRDEEGKAMQAFSQQKQGILQRQLEKQQQELALNVNREDIDALVEKHERERKALRTALEIEEQRQRENMQAKLKNRLSKLKDTEQERVRKEIKMAKLREIKEKQANQNMKQTGFSSAGFDVKDANRLQTLTEQVKNMREPIAKHAYSVKVEDMDSTAKRLRFFKKLLPLNQAMDYAKLEKYKNGEFAEENKAESMKKAISIRRSDMAMSESSLGDDENEDGFITFKELLKRVKTIEGQLENFYDKNGLQRPRH